LLEPRGVRNFFLGWLKGLYKQSAFSIFFYLQSPDSCYSLRSCVLRFCSGVFFSIWYNLFILVGLLVRPVPDALSLTATVTVDSLPDIRYLSADVVVLINGLVLLFRARLSLYVLVLRNSTCCTCWVCWFKTGFFFLISMRWFCWFKTVSYKNHALFAGLKLLFIKSSWMLLDAGFELYFIC
jgi:hypothetical protein